MGLIIGGLSASDLILDGRSVSLYVGGNPPTKVWPTRETVQITLDGGFGARNQLRAVLADRGLDYRTVTEIPFGIRLVGSGSINEMFSSYSLLMSAPALDTSSVTSMAGTFAHCSSLTYVPDLDTHLVTNTTSTFYNCAALTDGNVRLIGRHTSVNTNYMILNSGLTREPFFDTAGNPI